MIPGEYIMAAGDVEANQGKDTRSLTVVNHGDRPVQVGSHFHFYEVNPALVFDRERALGWHLNIPSGNAVRFEPGEARTVELTTYGGHQRIVGFRNAVNDVVVVGH